MPIEQACPRLLRQVWRCLPFLALVIALAACGGGERAKRTGVGRPQVPVEVSLFLWVQPPEYRANQELVRQFERSHPEIKVNLVNDPSQRAMDKLRTRIAGGNPPDVMSIHGAYLLPMAAAGVLMNLDQQIRRDPAFDLADFYPQLVEMCRYQGTLYSLPRYSSVYMLFYNRDLFDRAHIAYPDGSWTWEDYLRAAKRLTNRSDDRSRRTFGCVIDFWGARLYPWIWQNGGEILRKVAEPGKAPRLKCVLDQPGAVGALQFLVDLRHKYQVAALSMTTERRETLDMFKSGQIGMYQTGAWDVQTLRPMKQLRWEVAPLPRRKTRATLLGMENYAIAAKTAHPREAWLLFKFLLGKQAQTFMGERLEKQPSRISVANGSYQKGPYARQHRLFVEALGYGRAAPNIPEWDQIGRAIIQVKLDLIWTRQLPVVQGCAAMAKEVNQKLAEGAR